MLCISPFTQIGTVITMSSLHGSCAGELVTSNISSSAQGSAATAGFIPLIVPAGETFLQPLPWIAHSRELSVVEKIIVGVVVPVGIIVIASLALLCRRRQLRKPQSKGNKLRKLFVGGKASNTTHHQESMPTDLYIKPELDASAAVTTTVQPVAASFQASELPGARYHQELSGGRDLQEMPAQRDPVELDSGPPYKTYK